MKKGIFLWLIVFVGMIVFAGGLVHSGTINLPETGQTTCYDSTGALIACAGTGQDGAIQAGVAWPSPRFINNNCGTPTDTADDVVTDNLTGLMWTRNAGILAESTGKLWANALTYANGLVQCTYSDWRLPNVNEMESLINYGDADSVTWLTNQGFLTVKSLYWTSTNYATYAPATGIYTTGSAWAINISKFGTLTGGYLTTAAASGVPDKDDTAKTAVLYTWPVRGGI